MARLKCAYAAAALALAGCASVPASPQAQFIASVAALCGQAYAGRIVSTNAADAALAGQPLTMHVRACEGDAIRIPFHVGEDRSRTWVLRRSGDGLSLKHDHRHADGSEDALSQYGGDATAPGTATRQEFPADAFSRELFAERNIPASVQNVWAMEIHPGRMFAYELRRPNRLFRVEFDLTRPLPEPPPPWGAD